MIVPFIGKVCEFQTVSVMFAQSDYYLQTNGQAVGERLVVC